jgi:trehalose 6-phosphate synthase
MSDRPIVVVSNRGPVSFRRDGDGELVARRGAGGLVSGLSPLMRQADRIWIAAALSDDDRAAVAADSAPTTGATSTVPHRRVDLDGIHAVLAGIHADDLRLSYDVVCNTTLWYAHHHLFPLADRPVFDGGWFAAWDAYERVNAAVADLVAEVAPAGSAVLVQDYHLYLVAELLRGRRPDLALVHFSHTPFAEPHQFAVLPDPVRHRILTGLAAHHACGFHTAAWRDAFLGCCDADEVPTPTTFVAPLGPDATDLAATVASDACRAAAAKLYAQIGDRRCIARSERIELSKNLIRGFTAFDVLLRAHPEWREKVVFAASVYPSREANPDYVTYRRRTEACVAAINDRWATDGWTPILLDTSDHFPTSVATLARADVVLVNPIRDGLNLVASEAMLVNERNALLALSPQAGVWSVLGEAAAAVHPYDVVQTAEVLHTLLSMPEAARAATAARLRDLAAARTPADWLADQVTALA